MRAAWDTVKDSLERGTRLHFPNCSLEFTAVAEANNQQAFVDILDKDVIKLLETLKASPLSLAGIPVLI